MSNKRDQTTLLKKHYISTLVKILGEKNFRHSIRFSDQMPRKSWWRGRSLPLPPVAAPLGKNCYCDPANGIRGSADTLIIAESSVNL